MKQRSVVRHDTMHGLIRLCQKRELDGYECVVPIHVERRYAKIYTRHKGAMQFQDVHEESMFAAVYQKEAGVSK